jgi:hypothetical protein
MTEQKIQNSDQETEPSNVVSFAAVAHKSRTELPPTDEELAEYRRMRPALLAMIAEWPKLLKQHQAITSNCVLAKQILSGDP